MIHVINIDGNTHEHYIYTAQQEEQERLDALLREQQREVLKRKN